MPLFSFRTLNRAFVLPPLGFELVFRHAEEGRRQQRKACFDHAKRFLRFPVLHFDLQGRNRSRAVVVEVEVTKARREKQRVRWFNGCAVHRDRHFVDEVAIGDAKLLQKEIGQAASARVIKPINLLDQDHGAGVQAGELLGDVSLHPLREHSFVRLGCMDWSLAFFEMLFDLIKIDMHLVPIAHRPLSRTLSNAGQCSRTPKEGRSRSGQSRCGHCAGGCRPKSQRLAP